MERHLVRLMISAAAIACLALNIYHEARGEPIEGQFAVAEVVINRSMQTAYQGDICAVVFAPGQFSWTQDDLSDTPTDEISWEESQMVATAALSVPQAVLPGTPATFYHEIGITPSWSNDVFYVETIGRHVFYTGEE